MNISRNVLALSAAGALVLATASCGGGGSAAGGDPGKGGPVTIGIKFDQPGLGLQEGSS